MTGTTDLTDPTKQFHDELKAHLEKFQFPCHPPKTSVTVTGFPRKGLTVKYSKEGAAPLEDILEDVTKMSAAAAAGAGLGAGIGIMIGKIFFGSAARIGVASAGVGIGLPILAPFAVAGGIAATAAYGGYKLAAYMRERKNAQLLAAHLKLHMQEFVPSVPWPGITVYVPVPNSGLAALWQPPTEQQP